MKKVSLFITTILALTTHTYATDAFTTDYNVAYKIQPAGETHVTQKLTITNQKEDVIATSYSIQIKNLNVYDVSASSGDKKIETNETYQDDLVTISANFKDYIIGQGKQNSLTINYKSKDIATKIGEVWNINIPQSDIDNSTLSYNVLLEIPTQFGPKIYISPKPTVYKENDDNFEIRFIKQDLQNTGITASFGKHQYLNFKLKYQLENPHYLSAKYEIALPSDIPGAQQVAYSSIDPKPKEIYKDADGNTIAIYSLHGKKKVEVTVVGSATITSRQIIPTSGGNFKDIDRDLKKYVKAEKYWEVDSEIIKKLADELFDKEVSVSQNAQNIYDYVVKNLDYDFEIINEDFIDRKGAESALLQRGNWACMEFTDLFIALARTMGIPARELNGFAFTSVTDSKKPMSISFRGGDLLHAWPEFYDPIFGWVQIDPTWGNTSGVDYFTKLDTNHFVFVTKGIDSEYPLPAGAHRFADSLDEKLVEVVFSQNVSDADFEEKLEYKKKLNFNILEFLRGKRRYEIKNVGKVFSYNVENTGIHLAPNEKLVMYLKR
ncbi:transglutaminase family protein [bacterium]|nr:transglutaminase family protein [bacterium]